MKKRITLISWNVNGIRACYRKGCWDWVKKVSPDIVCIQETKAHEEQLPDEIRNPNGYLTFFDSPKEKRGYSGVGVLSKIEPLSVEIGMGVPSLDDEGRLITLHFKDFSVINTYFPNGGGGPHRLAFKLKYYETFLSYVEKIRRKQKRIIFCGDVNTAHQEVDLARPKENQRHTGFLPEERAWIDKVISKGYVDIFRNLYPHKREAYTYWDMKTFARERNVGWRIDYFFVTPEVTNDIESTAINQDILGSDHCPITLTLNVNL